MTTVAIFVVVLLVPVSCAGRLSKFIDTRWPFADDV